MFVPFYLKSGVAAIPQFLELRYSNSARTYLAVISVIAYVLTKISVTILGGVVLEAIGMDFWVGALLLVTATGIYTIFGGLKAVAYTDTMQMFVMFTGAIAVTYFGLTALGGWDELWNITLKASSEAGNTTGSNSYFEIWKPMDHPNYPWTGILFGAPILGIWYWCTDQFIVQRVLSAKNIQNAREGTIFAGFLKMLPCFCLSFRALSHSLYIKKAYYQVCRWLMECPRSQQSLTGFGQRCLAHWLARIGRSRFVCRIDEFAVFNV